MSGLLKLMLGGGTTESLIIQGVSYPNTPGYQSFTDVRLNGIGNYQYYPQVVSVQDKTFVAFSGIDADNNKRYIVVYDHFRGKVSDPVYIGVAGGGDIHHTQSIIATPDNKLYSVIADRSSPPNQLKSILSGNNFDIVNHDAEEVRSYMGNVDYSQFKVLSDGDVISVNRRNYITAPVHYTAQLWISSDNSVTFTAVNEFIDLQDYDSGSFISRPYPLLLDSDDDIIRCAFNILSFNGPFVGGRYTVYMETPDKGLSYRNVDNSWSKVISSEGPITHAESIVNCLVVDLGNNAYTCRANGSAYINGTPYIVGGGNSVSALSLFYWDGAGWQNKEIISAGHVINSAYTGSGNDDFNNSTVIWGGGGSNIYLICNEMVLGKSQMSKFVTSDQGDSWAFVEQISSNDNHHMDAQSDRDNKVIAFIEHLTTDARLFIDLI